ncbi:MAG TPA: hypothetical protein VED46_07465 [Alphaproteobacteria bacterium]|nr:hypothetical protein [Alphaproteobacteria bacterium]HXV84139.1 hypothetical protein [Candidatus Binatia bacterium]
MLSRDHNEGTGRISRQNMINEAREACIALRWRFGKKAMQRLLERTGADMVVTKGTLATKARSEGQSPRTPLSSKAA